MQALLSFNVQASEMDSETMTTGDGSVNGSVLSEGKVLLMNTKDMVF